MAPSGLAGSQWATTTRKSGAFSKYDLEQGTKMWQEMLEPAKESQTNQATSQPRVQGGLPPHLLRQHQDTNAPQTTGSPTPAASVKAPPGYPAPHDASLSVAHKQAHPPTTTPGEVTKLIPLTKANTSMHPLLQQVIGNRFSVVVRQDPCSVSPDGGAPHPPTYREENKEQHDQDKVTQKTQVYPQKKKWRPKHSEDLESHSLPSTAASVNLNWSDGSDFPDRSDDGNSALIKDVRGNIADELDIVPKGDGNGWVNKNAWKDYHSNTPSDEEAGDGYFIDGWKAAYCRKWIADLPKTLPAPAFCLEQNIDRHWECDIDPKDGFLMSPIEYPLTRINPNDPGDDQMLERRLRDTASMRASIEYPQWQKRVAKNERKDAEFAARNPTSNLVQRPRNPSTTPQLPHVPALNPVAEPFVSSMQQPSQGSNVTATEVLVGPVQQDTHDRVDGRQINISCHLRPAEMVDAPQVLEIYNWEVVNGCQALDAKPLSLQDIQSILMGCKSAHMPFIVAVQGTPMESASRQDSSAHPRGPYKQPRPTGPYKKAAVPQIAADKILGFGFISCPMVGLAGNVHTNVGRFIGRVHFYVDHASRRKGIGRAILHKLTRCGSKSYHSVDWYEWYDPVGAAVFKEPGCNPRNYSRLYIESSSAGENDPDNAWHEKFMDDMGYTFMSTMDKTRNLGPGRDDEWRDTILWQHDCREPKSINEIN
ncbi:hypothetical protein VPNG_07424 [Cytospora leucostoma]|uniref:N-acetyltransferase domain-containing protein n=1 Tax=Cytospora leucostoma TaxID=1230097 RepID=A0A423WMJ4_9PEZI|nr:hypothetical protein VPNG_07424 [Cytospora leucostoma]